MKVNVAQVAEIVSDTDTAFYREHGYWISPPLFDNDEITEMRTAVNNTLEGKHDFDAFPFFQSYGNLEWMREQHRGENSPRLRNLENAWWVNQTFRQVVTNPVIGGICARLSGESEVRLVHDQALLKPPQSGAEDASPLGNVGWHQDAPFFAGIDVAHIISAWIALQNTNEQNGALHFMPGSNLWTVDDNALGFFDDDLARGRPSSSREIVATLPAGAISFHDGRLFHASGPNLSNAPRLSIALNMMAGEARFNCDLRVRNPDANRFLCAQLGPFAQDGQRLRAPHFPRLWPENNDITSG